MIVQAMVILYSANNWKGLWPLIYGFIMEAGIESLAIPLVYKCSLDFLIRPVLHKCFGLILIGRVLDQTRPLILTWVQKKRYNITFLSAVMKWIKEMNQLSCAQIRSIYFCLFRFLFYILYSLTSTMMWIINFLMNSFLFFFTRVLILTKY